MNNSNNRNKKRAKFLIWLCKKYGLFCVDSNPNPLLTFTAKVQPSNPDPLTTFTVQQYSVSVNSLSPR